MFFTSGLLAKQEEINIRKTIFLSAKNACPAPRAGRVSGMLGPNKKSRFAGTKNRKNIRRDKRYYFKKMSVSEEVTTTVTTPVGKKHVGEYV